MTPEVSGRLPGLALGLACVVSLGAACAPSEPQLASTSATLLFVTQVPVTGVATVASTFGNHLPTVEAVPRGGDLWIRYPDGALRNLTHEAGFGEAGAQQGEAAIAVRDPSVYPDGTKALFSMVVGASATQYHRPSASWQIYEVTGLARGDRAVIHKVDGQPAAYNNISPFYGSDDRVLFVSDRPRNGDDALYPQRDEYEGLATVVGIYRLTPSTGAVELVLHAASAVLSPSLDSFGRVIFTQWDHLQRDQEADADRLKGGQFGSFDYADETASARRTPPSAEVFPEPRTNDDPLIAGSHVNGHLFNQFFPWQVNEDGSDAETLNHVGRHEYGGNYDPGCFSDDPNILPHVPQSFAENQYLVRNDGGFLQLKEDPTTPGSYLATNGNEFGANGAGGILRVDGDPSLNAEEMRVLPLTDPLVRDASDSADAHHTGRYRDPCPLANGDIALAHTDETRDDAESGAPGSLQHLQNFRLKLLLPDGSYMRASAPLTAGIAKTVSWWSPDELFTYSGNLWELQPVEVRARPRPATRLDAVDPVEKAVLDAAGVDEAKLRAWLTSNGLALLVSRNVTLRDRADVQQPYNLRVPNGTSAVPNPGKVYDVPFLQFLQGDQIRGYGGTTSPLPGRRILAQFLHDANAPNPASGGPIGSVKVAADGSMAAFVPATRVMTWQLTGADGTPVVRERNWVSFAPGEIRACPTCHGLNTHNQMGTGVPTNPPTALRDLMTSWKSSQSP